MSLVRNAERMATGARQTRRGRLTQGFSSDQQNRIAKQPLNGTLHDPMQANAPARPVLYEREGVQSALQSMQAGALAAKRRRAVRIGGRDQSSNYPRQRGALRQAPSTIRELDELSVIPERCREKKGVSRESGERRAAR
jgi:hypothetical protein